MTDSSLEVDVPVTSWLPPWEPIGPTRCPELAREIQDGYPMFGVDAHLVAARCDCDDRLYFLRHHSKLLAVVHLTWKAKDTPPFPYTEFYSNWSEWIENRMKPDNHEYEQNG